VRDKDTDPPESLAFAFGRRELAGAVADVGVLVPIAVALIVSNGLSPTAVFLPAGVLYVWCAFRYRLPVPVQPLKAFGAIAIAAGLGSSEIAAGALLMGAIFIVLSWAGWLDRVAQIFPRSVIRGVQLAVGLLFLKVAWGLVTDPPEAFRDSGFGDVDAGHWWLIVAAIAVAVLSWTLRRHAVALAFVTLGFTVMVIAGWQEIEWGPSTIEFPQLTLAAFVSAATVLVLPQLPLTFANSCMAPADAARSYFGDAARRVTPSRLARSLGVADVFAGAIGGMPVCHGAGGLTAHKVFGARTGGAPLVMGTALLVLALVFGAGLAGLLVYFPLPILAGLLATAGVLHLSLIRDLRHPADWAIALIVGVLGLFGWLALGLVVGLVLHVLARRFAARRRKDAGLGSGSSGSGSAGSVSAGTANRSRLSGDDKASGV